MLTPERVHLIRTAGKTDSYWSRQWGVDVRTIHAARTGRTWRDHPTPPDTRPRSNRGRGAPPEARIVGVSTAVGDPISRALREWRSGK